MFAAVGSASNVDDPDEKRAEFHRASILQFTPEGTFDAAIPHLAGQVPRIDEV